MPSARGRTARLYAAAGLSYLALGFVLWWDAWTRGASTHTLCGCGDPALFLWFFQWPATAVAHLHNPFYSTALFHPGGINLLAQTSVTGLSIPLIPVTWIWGPVASLNVASTITPALSALAAFGVLRRWVSWTPAAYLGGLLYGFSPFVLSSLQFAHLMTAAVMLLPLVIGVLDEILLRQRRPAWQSGLLLAGLLFWQFFLSSELLAILAVVVGFGLVVLVVAGWVGNRARLRALAPRAAAGLGVGVLVGVALLAYPTWFALAGPAHLSGLVWPNIAKLGGFDGSSFVGPDYIHGTNAYVAIGGYEGSQLPSAGYLGWGLLAVLAAGLVLWWRDHRMWFFAIALAFCVGCSFGERPGEWAPARLFAHIPVLENVIVQRFMAIGFFAAAAMLGLVLSHVRDAAPGWWARLRPRRSPRHQARPATWIGVLVAGAGAAGALVPLAVSYGPTLPFAMQAVTLPRWYTTVAPHLPANRVVLTYPAPFSGIQVGMAWQAVDADHFSQAGGGGPQGVAKRAGPARPGFGVLARLAFAIVTPQPTGSPAELAAVRRALSVWRVNTVVVAPQPGAPFLLEGHDPTYAAAFMTAVLGRMPALQAGAWVWDDVRVRSPFAVVPTGRVVACVNAAERTTHAGSAPTLRAARCVLSSAPT